MKISVVLGTRPEIIKMSPIIRECERRHADFSVVHTGQHYSYEMDKLFFEELELPLPDHKLDVGSGTHAEQTARVMTGMEKVILEEKPGVVLVQGDTNTVLGAALAASKLKVKVGHIEAGLRSFDRWMPEEINRVLADHSSDYLFAPTEIARDNLLNEGIPSSKIMVTGNTIVDAVQQNMKVADRKAEALSDLHLSPMEYILATLHRQENVDCVEKLKEIISGLKKVGERTGLPVIFPIHPRTRHRVEEHGLDCGKVRLTKPLGFLEFLQLENKARLVLTDSGGVQEETCILKVPCVTIRDSTERPETLHVGSNILVDSDPKCIVRGSLLMMNSSRKWKNPFGDGRAGERIVEACYGGALDKLERVQSKDFLEVMEKDE